MLYEEYSIISERVDLSQSIDMLEYKRETKQRKSVWENGQLQVTLT